jgi:hypothetical protein
MARAWLSGSQDFREKGRAYMALRREGVRLHGRDFVLPSLRATFGVPRPWSVLGRVGTPRTERPGRPLEDLPPEDRARMLPLARLADAQRGTRS